MKANTYALLNDPNPPLTNDSNVALIPGTGKGLEASKEAKGTKRN